MVALRRRRANSALHPTSRRRHYLRANGAEFVGEVVQYEDKYSLCYMRGPAGIIVAKV